MRLSRIIKAIDEGRYGTSSGGDAYDPEITSLHYRAQDVLPGGLFVAVCGHAADGHDYIDQAFSRGALAVVAQRRIREDHRIFYVPDSRAALAETAAAFFGNPSEALTLIGVTGTNGKTTVTYLVEGMLAAAGIKTGVIGTNNYRYAGRVFDSRVTTPESLDLQEILADMKAAGVSHVVMEVSSHGIDLGRVAACRFDVGAFTNLTQDHLDHHETMAAYWECKQRLFTELLPRGPKAARAVAVINADNPHGRVLCEKLAATGPVPRVISFGRSEANDVHPETVSIDLGGIRGMIATSMGSVSLQSRLVGGHNLENILCAVAVAVALKLSPAAIRGGLDTVVCVPGRLERVEDEGGRMVFVDYAHTPDALENVLKTLRSITRHRLICVFGCGGDRDRGKRPLMGRIAGRFCDLAVVTSDNPRTEVPHRIIDQIVAGVREEMPREIRFEAPTGWTGDRGFLVIPDRAGAIHEAIRAAGPGDVVLIAGKGHETYQVIGTEKRDFDDRRVAAEALQREIAINGVKGRR